MQISVRFWYSSRLLTTNTSPNSTPKGVPIGLKVFEKVPSGVSFFEISHWALLKKKASGTEFQNISNSALFFQYQVEHLQCRVEYNWLEGEGE